MLGGFTTVAMEEDRGALLHLHPHPRLQQCHPRRHPLHEAKGFLSEPNNPNIVLSVGPCSANKTKLKFDLDFEACLHEAKG